MSSVSCCGSVNLWNLRDEVVRRMFEVVRGVRQYINAMK